MIPDIDPRGHRLFILTITFLVLVWIVISLRGVARILTVRRVSVDDWLMFAAVLVYTAHSAITLWGIIYASEEGERDFIRGENIALQSWFLDETLYAPMSALIRSSIAYCLLRIATVKTHRRIICGCLVVTWVLTIFYFFLVLFQCSPPSYFYNQVLDKSGGTCINKNIVPRATIAHSILCALVDILLAFLPIAILWNIQLSGRVKAGLVLLLGMGFLAGIALIVRVPYVKSIDIADPAFLDQTNGTAFWSVMETSLGIIAGCIVTLRPLLRGFGRKRHTWTSESSTGRSSERSTTLSTASESERTRTQQLRGIKDDYTSRQPQAVVRDDIYGTFPQQEQANLIRATDTPMARRYDLRRSETPLDRIRDCTVSPAGSTLWTPESGGVRVKTSIEIKRESGSQAQTGRGTPLDAFTSHGGEQTVTIHGPSAYHRRFANPKPR
ncbi:hypothetical protein QBC42DRAFT_316648 [Cladorrhinum samala]|uniref:Rhodopsin domain-containing protein n=1 Tax=Cladorrhinum samala TaxID=585594 RepID=A0AAV9HD56_9PEZI|nr:hypothetical protein QBC42DRAFT_316648 [Cladorrhinum samala]